MNSYPPECHPENRYLIIVRSELSAASAVCLSGRAGVRTASAMIGIIALDDSRGHICIHQMIRLCSQNCAAGHLVVSRRDFTAHRSQLGLFAQGDHIDRQESPQQTECENEQDIRKALGLFRQIINIIRLSVSRLCQEIVAEFGIGRKRRAVISVAERRPELLRQIVNSGIGKRRNTESVSRNPPIPILHADQKQESVFCHCRIRTRYHQSSRLRTPPRSFRPNCR